MADRQIWAVEGETRGEKKVTGYSGTGWRREGGRPIDWETRHAICETGLKRAWCYTKCGIGPLLEWN